MYTLSQSLLTLPGIGEKTFEVLSERGISTIKDLLLFVPLRYEDRSQTVTVADLWLLAPAQPKTFFTIVATVETASSNYFRGRSMQKATFTDTNGDKLYANWFNNPFIAKRLKKGDSYRISGTAKPMGKKMFLTQPLVEEEEKESINTNRLVPIYSDLHIIKPTTLRKVLKNILENLEPIPDPLSQLPNYPITQQLSSIHDAISQIHFPDQPDNVIKARQRFAIEELIGLIQRSHQIKKQWKADHQAFSVKIKNVESLLPQNLPFQLTGAQHRCIKEIIEDLKETVPMNRLLLGDVGSGKTIVAGTAMHAIVQQGAHACLIAPTQVLAEQHAKTLARLFPDVHIELITGNRKAGERGYGKIGESDNRKTGKLKTKQTTTNHQPLNTFFVGTHAVLNFILKETLDTPIGLIVFDEQHRFGVNQRSSIQNLKPHPHILTMTATPIPRSLMLSIFSHLSLSVIDELPANRIPTKTWLVPQTKKNDMLDWLGTQIANGKLENGKVGESNITYNLQPTTKFQALYICPFIDPSDNEALENVAAVKDKFEELKEYFSSKRITIAMLHGRQKKKEQAQVIEDLFRGKIDLLVTTPIVEVGIDLPQASAVIIDSSERFGLASLHQLRGRVGRAGQQGFCMLFTNSKTANTKERLKMFSETLDGQKLAEFDLQHRGAGDLFGTVQHGFDDLKFASWTDVQLITMAKQISDQLLHSHSAYSSPIFTYREVQETAIPLAN